MTTAIPELSIIVPAYNESENIAPLYARLVTVLEQENLTFELIIVDDGSDDDTAKQVADLEARDQRVRLARFSRNFGHEAASTCGFDLARGQAVVLMDADLQDPPEVIPQLVARWREGFEVVYARRTARDGEPVLKKLTSYLFYRYFNRFSGSAIPADVGDFRLVDRRVVEHFIQLPERNRFVRGMFSWLGFRQTVVDFHRAPRHAGQTKYNYLKLFWLSFEAISSFSIAPLRLCMGIGAIVTVFAFVMAVIIILQRLLYSIEIPGYALGTASMFLLGGVQLIFLGVIGEYIGKIYTQVQGRPIYILNDPHAQTPSNDNLTRKGDARSSLPDENNSST